MPPPVPPRWSMNIATLKQVRRSASAASTSGHRIVSRIAFRIPLTPRLAMGGASIPRHTSPIDSRTSVGVGGRAAAKPNVYQVCRGGNGFVLRTTCLLERIPFDRVQFAVAVGDQHPSGVRVVAGHDHDMPTEVVVLGELEIRQEPHVEIHEHRLS